jgi:hypothetical protein
VARNAPDPPSLSKRAPGKPDLAKTHPNRRSRKGDQTHVYEKKRGRTRARDSEDI